MHNFKLCNSHKGLRLKHWFGFFSPFLSYSTCDTAWGLYINNITHCSKIYHTCLIFWGSIRQPPMSKLLFDGQKKKKAKSLYVMRYNPSQKTSCLNILNVAHSYLKKVCVTFIKGRKMTWKLCLLVLFIIQEAQNQIQIIIFKKWMFHYSWIF